MKLFFVNALLVCFHFAQCESIQVKNTHILGLNKAKTEFFGAKIDPAAMFLLKNAFGETHLDIIAAERALSSSPAGGNAGDERPDSGQNLGEKPSEFDKQTELEKAEDEKVKFNLLVSEAKEMLLRQNPELLKELEDEKRWSAKKKTFVCRIS